jgi:glutaconyl-CoA decarboxylase subunit alpha
MKSYFVGMPTLGKALKERAIQRSEASLLAIREIERRIAVEVERVKAAGLKPEDVNARGQMTGWQRIEYLVDPGTWCPLHTLYDPLLNAEGTTGVIDGLARVGGKWAVVIASNPQVLAGAWIKGQSENILRVTDMARRLHVPLVWILNCSGVKLTEQEEVFPNRRGHGSPFFRHAQLNQLGVPVLVGIYGTNPAGGGYHAISPTVLFAHKDCNFAVGGAGIVGGMSPKGTGFDEEAADVVIKAQRAFRAKPPGAVDVHYDVTGFIRQVYDTEQGVLDGIRDYMRTLPAYDPVFFRVAPPAAPAFDQAEIARIVPVDQTETYKVEEVIARLVDGSEHLEFRAGYGPEVYCGLVKLDGFLVGLVANRQGFLGPNYPEYADYPGPGGKLFRQGLIKMNEFVTLCARDRIPLVWLQDTSGIDVGNLAEKAELLALGQSLIYSIQDTEIAMACVVVRKAHGAAHYVLGGPTAYDHNVFTLGTPTSEVQVMHGETAAVACFGRRLVKEKDAGKSLQPVLDNMNALAAEYREKSTPRYGAFRGYLDEVVRFEDLRRYLVAFAGAVYQNPPSICPHHQMLTPRVTRG